RVWPIEQSDVDGPVFITARSGQPRQRADNTVGANSSDGGIIHVRDEQTVRTADRNSGRRRKASHPSRAVICAAHFRVARESSPGGLTRPRQGGLARSQPIPQQTHGMSITRPKNCQKSPQTDNPDVARSFALSFHGPFLKRLLANFLTKKRCRIFPSTAFGFPETIRALYPRHRSADLQSPPL